MFCSSCGAQISGKSAFCPSCGKPVQQPSAQPQFNPNDPQTRLHRSANSENMTERGTAHYQPPEGHTPARASGMHYMQQNANQPAFPPRGVPTQQGYMPQNAAPDGKKPKKGLKVFLFTMLFLILGAGLTVGGIFIGKALQASEQASDSTALT